MDLITINNADITIKEYQGQRVLTFKDIDEIHQRKDGTSRKAFAANKDRFIEGEDFFRLTYEEANRCQDLRHLNNPNGLGLITESGYLLLVKSFQDDIAWEIQRRLVKTYFRVKQLVNDLSTLSPQLQVLIQMEMNQKKMEEKLTQVTTVVEQTQQVVEKNQQDLQVAKHRIDNLDNINVKGDHRQKINAMVRKYAQTKGVAYDIAWNEFRSAFNKAYKANIDLRMKRYMAKNNLTKLTTPEYLMIVGLGEDGVRVADKLLNDN